MTDPQSFSSPRHSSLGPRPFFYRGRFAPSPTGPLHFGSLIAAVGSYLQARHQGGQWWLRIEDIDPPREVEGASEAIMALLAAYGFEWDDLSYQSRRHSHYAEALAQLQHQHLTYPCTCTRRRLREQQGDNPGPLIYPGTCRSHRFPCTDRHAIRVLTTDAVIEFTDRLQGKQICDLEKEVGDFVLRRADGYISYQLAVALDDAEQGMTEVVRGCDLLDSTPRQIHVQQQLGLDSPQYAHLPVVLGPDGQKLSKQTGARPLSPEQPLVPLTHAMQFLGHPVPEELQHGSLQGFWDWAIDNWAADRIPPNGTGHNEPNVPVSAAAGESG
ncbi:tRNA glutamyl-Q(34) synthetase GluQRS [Thiohalophilus sp.]|uniref:tRNA glutamyl-Q(34) synthetase GluQRS n=1 Tax=Thiohalophilus sp. TaxID=3028392 RepID=UPI002ACE24CE|nr:tRNA glutamyl-Q(34) synthetase GluQRS [Thiohalophilus sp.]MDZ7804632.1 tRNA glutamyl-Q(34) synthetase GluQRS [Thiohalophilus sp.]